MGFTRFVQTKRMSSFTKPSIPKGTRDFGPVQAAKRSYLIETIKKFFQKYGFSQIETPAMENLSVLTGKYGDEGDQLLFKILNSGDFLKDVDQAGYNEGSHKVLPKISEKGLRYDLTVPFARFVVQNRNDIALPFKRFQIQPVWRADRPQKGRYREFYQCDADSIGSDSLWNEAELTLLICDVFQSLKNPDITIKLNHREILNELASYIGLAGKEILFCVEIDKLDKVGTEAVKAALVAMGGNSANLPALFDLFESKGPFLERIQNLKQIINPENKGITDLLQYSDYLNATKRTFLPIQLDLSLARGLTYYTGMIFEVKSTDVQMGSICGGGRYDNLTGNFGLPGVSGVGISFGLDRIYDVLEEKNLFPSDLHEKIKLLICHFDHASFSEGIGLLEQMRSKGIAAELYPDQAKIKKQVTYADQIKAPYVILIGEKEIESQLFTLKNMQSGEQSSLTVAQITKVLMK